MRAFTKTESDTTLSVFKQEPDSTQIRVSLRQGYGEDHKGVSVGLTKGEAYDLGLMLMRFALLTPTAFENG